ncbi:MAG TPA: LytR C-terminal domain-containing protein [Mycobacteriales bacterium]
MDRLRSTLAAPGGARLFGALVALVGVVLLVVGVVALGGGDSGSSGAAPAPSPSVATSPAPSRPTGSPSGSRSSGPQPTTGSRTTAAPPSRTTAAPPATAARAPLTVLNNSTINGLADRAAGEVQNRGWQVAQVGNFGGRLPTTTVYYTPGDAAGQAAATELAREFPQIDQVLPRYAGLPPTPAGIVLVVTKDW